MQDLLAEMDLESLRFRDKMVELMGETIAIGQSHRDAEAREELVERLREANQNLMYATFGAQDLQAKAEGVSRRQDEFLSMLAHELRNPLAPVALACELFGRIVDAHPDLPGLHKIMSRQIKHMTRLVDDLMDASRISTGKITVKSDDIALAGVIESAIETSQPFIELRNQKLTPNFTPQSLGWRLLSGRNFF